MSTPVVDDPGLDRSLEELVRFLRSHGERHWSGWFADAAERLRAGDPRAVGRILEAYGGMGSFNDLVISPDNGHSLTPEDVDRVNRRMMELGAQVYRLAARRRNEPSR